MNRTRVVLSDDWKRNLQQSIAVKISALTLWVILPIALLITFINIYNLEERVEQDFLNNADLLVYRIGNLTPELNIPLPQDMFAKINAMLDSLQFSGLLIEKNNLQFEFGNHNETSTSITRQLFFVDTDNRSISINVIAYHDPIEIIANHKRKNILFPMVFSLLAFCMFLIWAIRTTIHKPFQDIVDATQAVSRGNQNIRLATDRQDEFGYISRFYNEMLDKLMEQQSQLQIAVSDANKANKAKSIFLANMSHELRTPLNAIIGYSEMLVEQATDLKQMDFIPDLHKIRTSGRFLLDLINNILDLTKIEAGKMEIHMETVNVPDMIEDIISTIQPLIEKNHNSLTIDIDSNITEIVSDYTKLQQSIVNLLSNASKFTKEGIISFKVFSTIYKGKRKILFEVKDNGKGIDQDNLSELFKAFNRGNDSAKVNKINGTGLGLVISREYCNMLDGEISVHSAIDKGTTFTIHLPYIEPKEFKNRNELKCASNQ